MKRIALLLSSALLIWAGCNLLNVDQESTPSPRGNGRIVFGESIENVKIGDDTTAVINKLGRPDHVGTGDFPGSIFEYVYPLVDSKGYRDSLEVTIIITKEVRWEQSKGVQGLKVSGSYSGETRNGVGLGVSRESALVLLGEPDRSSKDDDDQIVYDNYYFEENAFSLKYIEGKLQVIWMVPHQN